jgi:hypothetical protein
MLTKSTLSPKAPNWAWASFDLFVFNRNTVRFFLVVLSFLFVCEIPNWRQIHICTENANYADRQGEKRASLIVCYILRPKKPKDMHRTFVFVFKTCCFSVHVKGICEKFACREPNRNVKLVTAAPAASNLRLYGKTTALHMLVGWPSNCRVLIYTASSNNALILS